MSESPHVPIAVEASRVLITGGTSGTGLAIARYLQRRGARVMVTGRSADRLAEARSALAEDAVLVRSDASSLPDVEALADAVTERFDNLDVLVLNAGINVSAPVRDTTPELSDEVLAVDACGPYLTARRFSGMLADGGAIVFTTSLSGVTGLPSNGAHVASTAALRSMTRTFARELAGRGVRVNAVLPGPIDTEILDRTRPETLVAQTTEQLRACNPMERFGHPDEIARAVYFLAYEATFTTGAELPVDGGASQL
jgi:NAD(P)-dependent dehydrogenase (short-subunit alcohol dehydrogenase family)